LLPTLAQSPLVIAVEPRGFGQMPDRDAPFGFVQDADDVTELPQQLVVP